MVTNTPSIRQRALALITDYLIVDVGCDPARIVDAATFTALGCDGLDSHEIIMALEGAFGIEISDDEIEAITTVGEAIGVVEGKVAGVGMRQNNMEKQA